MIKVVLLALTLILASSLTVTNTFNGPIGAVRGPPMVAIPHYPLGNLKTGDTISVTFNMPKPVGTDTLSLITAVAVVDSAYSVVATPTFTLGVLTGLTQGTVTGADAIPADGAHYLRVTGSGSNINAVEIEIRINGVVKFRYADMIRRNLGYYIRLNSAITQSVTVDSTISAGNTGYYEIILGGSGFTFSSFAGDRTSSTVASGSFTESAAMGAGARAISPYWAA